MINHYINALKNYVKFDGRASRSEYWYFALCQTLIYLAFNISIRLTDSIVLSLIFVLFLLSTVIPTISVTARRLHDTNRSGWFQLINLVPLVGMIVMIVLLSQRSDEGANRFGDSPQNKPQA